MSRTERPSVPLEGAAAPPRRNGEIVFDAPWESRVFGIAAVMQDHGRWSWDDFAARFQEAPGDDVDAYYLQWLGVLESLLIEQGMLTDEELDARTEQFAQGLFDDHSSHHSGR